jgi:hypothetical protein
VDYPPRWPEDDRNRDQGRNGRPPAPDYGPNNGMIPPDQRSVSDWQGVINRLTSKVTNKYQPKVGG